MLETKDLILRKAVFEDWPDLYENVWSRAETARYMLWQVTNSEEAAMDRMRRTIAFEQEHPYCYIVEEKSSHRVIGFAGMIEKEPGLYTDCGIAVGPEYTGRGYGKQILNALANYAKTALKAQRFGSGYRIGNIVSMKMQYSCGFSDSFQENLTDPRTGESYTLQYTEKTL